MPGPGSVGEAGEAPGKPPEVEEAVDEFIHRPLARPLVRLLVPTPITPNQVTLLSAAVGVVAALLMAGSVDRPGWRVLAGLALLASVVLDCCDGQLARARGSSSTYGAILDGIADYVTGVSLGIGVGWYLVHLTGDSRYWLLALVGIASSAVHSALFDHTKTRYIARVGRGYREREEDLSQVATERDRAWRERRLRDALLLGVYFKYTTAQHAAMDVPTVGDPTAYRQAHGRRMRAWTFLGVGTHFALAYVIMVMSRWWELAPASFFVLSSTVLNVMLVLLLLLERRAAGG
jgi:hypothetical protein